MQIECVHTRLLACHNWHKRQWFYQIFYAAGLGQDSNAKLQVHTFSETTAVQFGELSDEEIAAYIATGVIKMPSGSWLRHAVAALLIFWPPKHMLHAVLSMITNDAVCVAVTHSLGVAPLTFLLFLVGQFHVTTA